MAASENDKALNDNLLAGFVSLGASDDLFTYYQVAYRICLVIEADGPSSWFSSAETSLRASQEGGNTRTCHKQPARCTQLIACQLHISEHYP